jgi:hypothetical protein
MNFDQFKKKVFKLAGKQKYLIPGSNTLFKHWQQELSPKEVVNYYTGKQVK